MEEKTAKVAKPGFSDMLRTVFDKGTSAIVLIALLFIGVFCVSGFATGSTITQLIVDVGVYGMVAVGMSLMMMTASIDFSIGYQVGLTAVVTVFVVNATDSLILAILAGCVCGMIMGAINGFFIVKMGLSPLIGTMALQYVYQGIVNKATNASSFPAITGTLKSLYEIKLFGTSWINMSTIIFFVLLVIIGIILRRTKYGNNLYVVGGNREAALLGGISPTTYCFICYILCGLCSGVAGILLASRFNSASYTLGSTKMIFAVSACVIGGIKFTGGKGTMTNVLVGVLIMRIVQTMMNLLLVPAAWTDFVSGAVLILILIFDRLTKTSAQLDSEMR